MPAQDQAPAPGRRHGGHRRAAGAQARARAEAGPRSEAFEAYYAAQRVVPEEEWADFLGTLRTPLPIVVRVNRTKPHWRALQSSFEADGRWTSLPWLTNAWKCTADHYDDALQKQCGRLNKSYALRFQEAASLVPPLMLGLQRSDIVLDMCAAPGSKTLECLELMRAAAEAADPGGGGEVGGEGVVVANDADAERAFELLPMITRKARHPGTIVTLVSAAKFPPLFEGGNGNEERQLLFDRVVCDVPCSGDGTLRKRLSEWPSWSARDGLSLHAKQLQLLCRGLHLLRPGGRLAYSTCSMNPVENEAVVAAALARYRGDVSLDPHAREALEAQGLSTSPGLSDWGVPAPADEMAGQLLRSWADVSEDLRKPKGALCETMFPPSASGDDAEAAARAAEVVAALPAGCVRLDPHKIDGSGFFVAVFEKHCHRLPPASPETAKKAVEEADPRSDQRLAWRARNDANHYEVISGSSEAVQSVANFYGMTTVPGPLIAEFNTKGRLTQLNLVNEKLLHFLSCRLQCRASPLLISVGVPLFKPLDHNFMTNIEVPSRWRPAFQGAAVLAPLMSKRVVRLDSEVMTSLLSRRVLPMAELQRLAEGGQASGVDSCEGLLGGALVGLRDGTFWAPCIITGQGLELYASAEELGSPAPELLPPLRFTTLAEGPGYVAVSKPSGLRTEDVLRTLHQGQYGEAELVSRLDMPTSGCMLVPTGTASAAALTAQFSSHTVHKTYLALVWGTPPACGTLDAPLALGELGGGARYRAYVDAETGKEAETKYRTLWASRRCALVAAFPTTGRTHQIRCHLSHAGFPLVGDAKYGGCEPRPPPWCTRLPLHCLRVIACDERGGDIDVMAPLPEDFAAMLDVLTDEGAAHGGGASETAVASWHAAVQALIGDEHVASES